MNTTKVLKVAIYTRNGRFKKLDERVAELIAPVFNMPYELIVSVDGEIGRRLENGYWTGVAGMVMRGDADFAASLTPTEERSKIVNFSYPYVTDQVTFITGKSEMLGSRWAFLYPFSNEVWFILIFSVIMISIMLYILLHKTYKYLFILLNVIGSISRQPWLMKTEKFGESALCIFWLVGITLITHFYTTVLLSFFSFPPMNVIRDIKELSSAVVKGTHQCLTFPGSHIPSSFVTYGDEAVRLIGENLKRHKGSFNPLEVLQSKSNDKVFIQLRNSFVILQNRYYVSQDAFQELHISVAFGKNFCCRKTLESAIHRATAGGFFEKLQQDTYYLQYLSELLNAKVPDKIKTLSITDLSGAFIFMSSSYAFALFVLILEILSVKIHCFRNKNMKIYKPRKRKKDIRAIKRHSLSLGWGNERLRRPKPLTQRNTLSTKMT